MQLSNEQYKYQAVAGSMKNCMLFICIYVNTHRHTHTPAHTHRIIGGDLMSRKNRRTIHTPSVLTVDVHSIVFHLCVCARISMALVCVCVCIRVYMCLGGWISMWTMSLCVSLYARRKINFLLSPPSLSLKSNNQFLLYTFFLCVFLPYIAFFPLWLLLLLFYSDHDFTRRVSKLYVLWSHTKKKWHSFIRVWECVFSLSIFVTQVAIFFRCGTERM